MVDSLEVLNLLEARRNVLLSGPPATGKSILLGEVATRFEGRTDVGTPHYSPENEIPIPQTRIVRPPGEIGNASNRKVFRTVLHQSSKYRDFLTGVMPDLRSRTSSTTFRVSTGTLYRASEYAKHTDSAALLIIDEINRGPTVQVFGGAIAAMEADKRLDQDGSPTPRTQFFDLLDPDSGELIEYAFPPRLYILAAMNQADVSVEPIDVAFLRRWAPLYLEPSPETLRSHFHLPPDSTTPIPERPSSPADIFEAAVRAFVAANRRIALGRDPEFRIGHGVLMAQGDLPSGIDAALDHVAEAWRLIKNHIDEAFFGDVRGTAIVLNAHLGLPHSPFVLEENSFGDTPRPQMRGPISITRTNVYDLLRTVADPNE